MDEHLKDEIWEEKILSLLEYDLLTGVNNRYFFKQKIDETIQQFRNQAYKLALLFIDFDNFQDINDTIGHEKGDALIRKIAACLKEQIPTDAYLGRYGQDKFMVLLPFSNDKRSVWELAQGITRAFETPCLLDKHTIYLSPNIGIAIFPDNGENSSVLMRKADIAMLWAKKEWDQDNKIQFYSKDMEAIIREKFEIQNQLVEAIRKEELSIYYQPIIDLQSGNLAGVEALLRWFNQSRGWISPLKIINIAEETGQIYKLGEFILRKTFQDLKRWEKMGEKIVPVAINISVKQLEKRNFGQLVKEIVEELQVDTKYIEFEITESIAAGNLHIIQENLLAIKELGIKISMDDFGTGYSSLAMLLNLQVDKIKIDKLFIDRIGKERDEKIIMVLIKMAQELGLKVVAEGVETLEQLKFLKNLSCHYGQGYFWAKPMSATNFEKII